MIPINPESYKSENVLSEKELLKTLDYLKKAGKKIGLCGGCFDLLHPGHITHFEDAKKVCDVLVVAVAMDSYITKKHAGSGKPIFSQDIRAFMISKLKAVDFVMLHDGSAGIVDIVKPDVYIRGPDYSDGKDSVVCQQIKKVESYGGKMYYTQPEKLSSTGIIQHIKEEIK